MNISAALAEVFNQIRESNRLMDQNALTAGQAAALLAWWDPINQVLQLQREAEAIPGRVTSLLDQRAAARLKKDWFRSDSLRAEIETLGWLIKDTKEGQKVTRKQAV